MQLSNETTSCRSHLAPAHGAMLGYVLPTLAIYLVAFVLNEWWHGVGNYSLVHGIGFAAQLMSACLNVVLLVRGKRSINLQEKEFRRYIALYFRIWVLGSAALYLLTTTIMPGLFLDHPTYMGTLLLCGTQAFFVFSLLAMFWKNQIDKNATK